MKTEILSDYEIVQKDVKDRNEDAMRKTFRYYSLGYGPKVKDYRGWIVEGSCNDQIFDGLKEVALDAPRGKLMSPENAPYTIGRLRMLNGGSQIIHKGNYEMKQIICILVFN